MSLRCGLRISFEWMTFLGRRPLQLRTRSGWFSFVDPRANFTPGRGGLVRMGRFPRIPSAAADSIQGDCPFVPPGRASGAVRVPLPSAEAPKR